MAINCIFGAIQKIHKIIHKLRSELFFRKYIVDDSHYYYPIQFFF